jgi:serine/threonine protein kinase
MITEKIGRYEVKSEIARGGMATVYHAYDPNFERDVAIKVLPQAFLHDPQFRVRFEREAKMIAHLEHPAIVPVYDFGEEEGQPYIVMRYMSGGSLSERIDESPLSLSETAQIISRLAPSLDAAHARHIIHRDLKPGNVLFDQYGNAFLSDFGIARLTEESGMTLTGTSILGTPAYMSPEQVQGDKQIDGRSDIYSLGVLIFHMLTGQVPYQADSPAKVMMMHVLHPIPNILEADPDLPASCQGLIAKSMAKEPTGRYSTAGELAAVLENIAHGTPALVSTPSMDVIGREAAIAASQMPTALSASETVAARPRVKIPSEQPVQAKPPRSPFITIVLPILIVLFILAAGAGGLAYLGRQGSGPLAFLAPAAATATALPTNTPPPATETLPPATAPNVVPTEQSSATPTEVPATPTETLTPVPQAPVIGGADKIAYLSDSDIWIANLDGSGLMRLTEDGTTKNNLQWAPDGQSVNYISGNCVFSVRLSDPRVDIVVCFNFVEYLKAFEISPDGTKVAISLDNQLYLVPYDLGKLTQVQVRSDLTEMAECKDFAPYLNKFVKYVRWSRDGQQLAMVIMGAAVGIGPADTVQVIPIDACTASPRALDNFPPPRFRPPEYETVPTINNFGWDGLNLFSLNTVIRNNGFGNLHIYNMDLHKARMSLNPINNACCYRDSVFSPDGTYLLFAFQLHPGGDGSIQFYYIPYGNIGTGVTYAPLPLPPITTPSEHPQPALHTAK